jgi:hypothetical protein
MSQIRRLWGWVAWLSAAPTGWNRPKFQTVPVQIKETTSVALKSASFLIQPRPEASNCRSWAGWQIGIFGTSRSSSRKDFHLDSGSFVVLLKDPMCKCCLIDLKNSLIRHQQFGVYFILKSMELGPSLRSAVPRFPIENPHYRILARQRSRNTHYYFYSIFAIIRDEVLGPIALCVGSFLPFSITYYLNGHSFIQRELERAGMGLSQRRHPVLWAADPQVLQEMY